MSDTKLYEHFGIRRNTWDGSASIGAEVDINGRKFRHAILINNAKDRSDANLIEEARPELEKWAAYIHAKHAPTTDQ